MSDDTPLPVALTQGQVFTARKLTRVGIGEIDFIEGAFTSAYAQLVNPVAPDASTAIVYIEGPREVLPEVFDVASIRIGVDQ